MIITRITFELVDEKDSAVIHKKVYTTRDYDKLVNYLTEIAHIHDFSCKMKLLIRLQP